MGCFEESGEGKEEQKRKSKRGYSLHSSKGKRLKVQNREISSICKLQNLAGNRKNHRIIAPSKCKNPNLIENFHKILPYSRSGGFSVNNMPCHF